MFVEFLIGYIVLPIVFTIECRVVINIRKRRPTSVKHEDHTKFALRSSLNHIPIKYRGSNEENEPLKTCLS